MNLSTIQRRIEIINEYEKEMKTAKEMLKAELDNDESFTKATEEYKLMVQKRKRIKDEVLNRADNKKLVDEIKHNAEEVSSLREILSTELIELYQKNKTDQIDDGKGNHLQVVFSAKLRPSRG